MESSQVERAAECLGLPVDVARERALVLDGDLVKVSSDVRGVGSVLVGPDLSLLFVPTAFSTDEAVARFRDGLRTERGKFDALLDQLPDRQEFERDQRRRDVERALHAAPPFKGMLFRGRSEGATFTEVGDVRNCDRPLDLTRDVSRVLASAPVGLYCVLASDARDARGVDGAAMTEDGQLREYVLLRTARVFLAHTTQVAGLAVHLVLQLRVAQKPGPVPAELVTGFEQEMTALLQAETPPDVPVADATPFVGDIG